MASNNFLEANDNIMERNLRFVQDGMEDNLKQFFDGSKDGAIAPPRDYKVVTPLPGFCVKTFKLNSNEKFFINVCRTNDIPAPEDISEERLTAILESDLYSSYRIPMSISEPCIAKDKSNNPVDVTSIAINQQFYNKCQTSKLFHNFFLQLIAEALSEKYNIQINMERIIILNNRKVMGSIGHHRVRNTDVKAVLNTCKNLSNSEKQNLLQLTENTMTKQPLVQEIDESALLQLKNRAQLSAGPKSTEASTEPESKLRGKKNKANQIEEVIGEFFLPKCVTSADIQLDVGEDRIVLGSKKHGYHYDAFVGVNMIHERAKATFNKLTKMLTVYIPVAHGN